MRHFETFGEAAAQPEGHALGCFLRNGTVVLRNRHGVLAYVTAHGKVFGRIGGNRLEGGEA
jgi:hypothetical protein